VINGGFQEFNGNVIELCPAFPSRTRTREGGLPGLGLALSEGRFSHGRFPEGQAATSG
jgi:hypothetical protein